MEEPEPKPNVIALEGGPFDGAVLPIDVVPHEIHEVIFRTTADYPLDPQEILYQLVPGGPLPATAGEALKNYLSDVRVWPFRPAQQTELMDRFQEQERKIERLNENDQEHGAQIAKLQSRIRRYQGARKAAETRKKKARARKKAVQR